MIKFIAKMSKNIGKALIGGGLGGIAIAETAIPIPVTDTEMILKYSIEFVSVLTAFLGALAHFINEVKHK
jgi:hypothetical protein